MCTDIYIATIRHDDSVYQREVDTTTGYAARVGIQLVTDCDIATRVDDDIQSIAPSALDFLVVLEVANGVEGECHIAILQTRCRNGIDHRYVPVAAGADVGLDSHVSPGIQGRRDRSRGRNRRIVRIVIRVEDIGVSATESTV